MIKRNQTCYELSKIRKTSSYCTFALSMVLLLCLSATVQAQNSDITLFEGVVVDPAHNAVYLRDPSSNLKALDLQTGEEKWSVNRSLKPLLVVNGRVLCQAQNPAIPNEFDIVELDIAARGVQRSEYSSLLPSGVKTNQAASRDGSFKVSARLVRGRPYLKWNYQEKVFRGINNGEEDNQLQNGLLRVNQPALQMDTLSVDEIRFSDQSILKQRLTDNANIQEFYSADRKHYIKSSKVGDNLTFFNYTWEVFQTSNNQKIGELNDYRSYATFYVQRGIIVYTTGPYQVNQSGQVKTQVLALRGYDLLANRESWILPFLDPIYRGPTPP